MAMSIPSYLYRTKPVRRTTDDTGGLDTPEELLAGAGDRRIDVPTPVTPPVLDTTTGGTPAPPAAPKSPYGPPEATPAYLLKLLQGGMSPQEAANQFNKETGRGYGNEAVYYGHNNTIGLPEAYLSTGANGWNISNRVPEGPGRTGGSVAPPTPQGWAKYKTPDGTPFADQVDPGLWKDEKGRTWAFLGPNGSLIESKVPGPAQPPTQGGGSPVATGYVPGKGIAGMGSIFSEGIPAGPEKDFYNQLLAHAGGGAQGPQPSPFAQAPIPDEFGRQLIALLQQRQGR